LVVVLVSHGEFAFDRSFNSRSSIPPGATWGVNSESPCSMTNRLRASAAARFPENLAFPKSTSGFRRAHFAHRAQRPNPQCPTPGVAMARRPFFSSQSRISFLYLMAGRY
jgi:hypothetical protein